MDALAYELQAQDDGIVVVCARGPPAHADQHARAHVMTAVSRGQRDALMRDFMRAARVDC